MDNTLLSGFIEGNDRFVDLFLHSCFVAAFDGHTGFANHGAGSAAEYTVMDAAFLVLPISFDLGLDISQLRSSEKFPSISCESEFYPQNVFSSIKKLILLGRI